MTSEQYYRQALADLSYIRQKVDDNGRELGEVGQAVARLEERGMWHERRIGALEEWRQKRTRDLGDTQRNDANEARAMVAKMKQAEADRRKKIIGWAAGVAASVASALVTAWALGGCA